MWFKIWMTQWRLMKMIKAAAQAQAQAKVIEILYFHI